MIWSQIRYNSMHHLILYDGLQVWYLLRILYNVWYFLNFVMGSLFMAIRLAFRIREMVTFLMRINDLLSFFICVTEVMDKLRQVGWKLFRRRFRNIRVSLRLGGLKHECDEAKCEGNWYFEEMWNLYMWHGGMLKIYPDHYLKLTPSLFLNFKWRPIHSWNSHTVYV